MTQSELAKKSGLKQATISSLEHDRVVMGIDRAKALALALKVYHGQESTQKNNNCSCLLGYGFAATFTRN
jgi:transcriptional regulator with XRE-family HTH domain